MLDQARQTKLDPILDALREIDGIAQVTQDDFDSVGINVFIALDVGTRSLIPVRIRGITDYLPLSFPRGIRSLKSGVSQVCARLNVNANFLHWPSKPGRTAKEPYDCEHIKLEVFV